MILAGTNETLLLVTSSASAVKVTLDYVDTVSGTTLVPGNSRSSIAAATTTTILAAPSATVQRKVTRLGIVALGAVVVTVKIDVGGTAQEAFAPITLASGESLQFVDKIGWRVHGTSGEIKTSGSGGGGAGVTDGNKGGVTVSGSGSVWDVNAGLDAAKVADGTVSNTEFQYLNGLTEPIPTTFGTLGTAILARQPLDATLTALSGLATSADQIMYSTGSDAFAMTSLSAFARTLIDDTSNTAARTTLGLGTSAILDSDTDATLSANSTTRVPTQSAVKAYVDNSVFGLFWKSAVVAATTANGTLATSFANGQVVDGVTLVTGDRILIKNQTTASENGIYIVSASGAPTRSNDANTGPELVGATLVVLSGTVNADTQWNCNNDSITIGSTSVTFVQISGAGTYSAGAMLGLSGNQFSVTNANLLALGGQTGAADRVAYFTGVGAMSLMTVTAAARTVLDDTTVAAMVDTLGGAASSGTGGLLRTGSPTITTPVLTGLPTGTGVASAPTASTLAARDSRGSLSVVSTIDGYTTTVTAAGTTTLTVSSNYHQYFTGTTTQTCVMPVASSLVLGQQFRLVNNSTGVVTVNSSGANLIVAMVPGSEGIITCTTASGTTAASWDFKYSGFNSVTGTGAAVLANGGDLSNCVGIEDTRDCTFDGGGSPPTVNSGMQKIVRPGGNVVAAGMLLLDDNGDRVAGDCTVTVYNISSGGTPTTLGTIVMVSGDAGYKYDVTLSGWVLSIATGESIKWKLTTAPTTGTRLSVFTTIKK